MLPLYFPNGRLVSVAWKWVTRLVVVFGACATGLAVVRSDDIEAKGLPNPLGIESLSDGARTLSSVLDILLSAGWLLLGSVAVASLIVRFIQSRRVERQQLEWFLYAVVLLLVVNTAGQLFSSELLPSALREFLFVFTLEGLWVAIGIAILRYRLYDIDIIINRTLVYGSLTATLVAIYFGGIVVLQRVFVALTGEQSTLAVVAPTLIIAALFNPLRRGIQSFIDRRFYRKKYDARKTIEAFSSKLRDETDLEALGVELMGVVRETMQPAHVSLWLSLGTDQRGEQKK